MDEAELSERAEVYIQDFAKSIYKLSREEDYDIVIAPGNSGVIMAKLAEMVYKRTSKNIPPVVQIPTERELFKSGRNDEILSYIRSRLTFLPNQLSKILLIDSEMGEGTTAQASLNLAVKLFDPDKIKGQVVYTIVAELRKWPNTFVKPESSNGSKVDVIPVIYSYVNASNALTYEQSNLESDIISNFFRPPLLKELVEFLTRHDWTKKTLNVALNVPVKIYNQTHLPEFTDCYNIRAEQEMETLSKIRDELAEYLNDLIGRALPS